jgi:hypothetical protein
MPALDLTTYARIVAHLACRRGARLSEVLADLGIDGEELARAEPDLRRDLAGAWPNRMGIGAMRFATALATELEALGPLASDTQRASQADPVPVPVVAEPEKALPSFLQPVSLPTPSFAPVMPPDAPEPPPFHRPPARLAGTMDADLSAIVAAVGRSALPFSAPTAAPADTLPLQGPPQPLAPPSVPQRAPAALSGTVGGEVTAFAPATPFAPAPAAPAAPAEVDLSKYPLELYAALTGALARGEPREKVLAECRLTPALFDTLAHAWGARLTADPELLVRFTALARSSAAQAPRKA